MDTKPKDFPQNPNFEPKASTSSNYRAFWSKAQQKFHQCAQESSKFFRVGKLKWDTASLQRKRNDLYQKLGRTVFDLLEQQRFETHAVEHVMEEIHAINQEILSRQANIQEITHSKIKTDTENPS